MYVEKVFKELYKDIEVIKIEIEEYFKTKLKEDIKLNYKVIQVYEGPFFGCVDDDNNIKFNLKFISEGYGYLFNRILEINPDNPNILECVIKILLICILVHESHHFYYKKYKNLEYIVIKEEDDKKTHRKDKKLEVLADDFMINFMGEKGKLHYMIAGLSEKFNQMKNDGYTKDDRIEDIVKEVRNIYT